jgi:hypothetical protein
MMKVFLLLALAIPINANAGFLLGYAVGASTTNQQNCPPLLDIKIDMRTPTFFCNVNREFNDCKNEKAAIQIAKKGYKFYHLREAIKHGDKNYLVYDVWN